MRIPEELPRTERPAHHRRRIWVIGALVVLVVLLASLHSLATVYTDALWFNAVHLASVWRRLFDVKVGMFLVFGAVFFVVLWASLAVVDHLAPSELSLGPEDELVRRYQHTVAPHAVALRTVVSLVGALIAASSTLGQWQNYLLFRYGVSWGVKDPQFHKDIGFFVFKLPFLSFLVSWAFLSLVVITLLTVVFHYLSGGIRLHREPPRVAPQVKVHLSVLLALIALVKAAGYVIARYQLDTSANGYVQGAGYTDVHARLPALELLVWVSLAAVVVLLVNIRIRGWLLPVLAVGTWAFVAVVAGAVYPAILQAVKVNPAQSRLEAPYIGRNIAATRAAFGLNDVTRSTFTADQQVSQSELDDDTQSLDDVNLWDPALPSTATTFTKDQQSRGYYTFESLATDRYDVNGQLTPVVIGVRQIDDTDLPAQGWVNTHLQYTHGYGAVVALANEATSSSSGNGSTPTGQLTSSATTNTSQPVFAVANVPEQSSDGLPTITQPDVYYGLNNGSDAAYVVADTKQPEVDYELPDGNVKETHYTGGGGVQLGGLLTKAAFAVRFSDLNLLISNLITPQSRLLMYQNVQQAISNAAPFLSLDSAPYPVIANGQIYWVQDAYTTTADYPYSQDADTAILPPSSGVPSTVNYVRNSVVVAVNAYTGRMTFFVTDGKDPIIRTWERIFPHMFTKASKMATLIPGLQDELRYGQDIDMLQAQTYGRYHITDTQAFYNAANAWTLSQDPGSGAPDSQASTIYEENAQGQIVSTGQTARMEPTYEVVQLPGQHSPTFELLDALVPYSSNNQVQLLSGFVAASSSPSTFGHLTDYVTPPGADVDGPSIVDGLISQDQAVSNDISLLNQQGSSVVEGNVIMVPVGNSMLYFRPIYVQASRNPVPDLAYVVAVYQGPQGTGNQVALSTTLQGAISQIFSGTSLTVPESGTAPATTTVTPSAPADQQVQSDIAQAVADEQQAQTDLKNGNFAAYGSDETSLQNVLQQLQSDGGLPTSSTGSSGSSGSTGSSGTASTGGSSSTGSASSGSSGGGSSGKSGSSGKGSGSSGKGSGSSGSTKPDDKAHTSSTSSNSTASNEAEPAKR